VSHHSTDSAPSFVADWPTCAHDDGQCAGRRVGGFEHCLAHLGVDDLDEVLHGLSPGADLDLRGTNLTAGLLERLRAHMAENPAAPDSPAHIGHADFRYCRLQVDDESNVRHTGSVLTVFRRTQFSGDVWFDNAEFSGDTKTWFHRSQFRGNSSFNRARFRGRAEFANVQFGKDADFGDTRFNEKVEFSGAEFSGNAVFRRAEFSAAAGFEDTRFSRDVWFDNARFSGYSDFDGAQFGGNASFNGTQFSRNVSLDGAQFGRRAAFAGARFESLTRFGPLAAGGVDLERATFAKRVVVEVEAGELSAVDARFEEGVELRARHARISLRRTFFGAPSSLSGAIEPFASLHKRTVPDQEQITTLTTTDGGIGLEQAHTRPGIYLENRVPRLLSVQQTDVSQLTLADVDLQWCRFAGAHQLDKLRLEGRSPFNRPPSWQFRWAWPLLWRWSPRRLIAEEHPWRAQRRKSRGWTRELPNLTGAAPAPPVGPERLAVLYRSLRKAFEDAKNEAGAGDFYYGEMEARRHAPSTSRSERAILTAYWIISGYGQRASRALAALVLLIGLLFALLTQFGLPDSSTMQQMTGTIPAAVAGQPQQVTLDVRTAPSTLPPPNQRWTANRMGQAARIALGSVVFRDSDQKLTPAGTWTVMAGRAFGPLVLALAALAVRARVKR
jgi:Pentapeptide repeats (9 copies)